MNFVVEHPVPPDLEDNDEQDGRNPLGRLECVLKTDSQAFRLNSMM